MHGLVNRAMERFLRETFGAAAWQQIAARAGLPFDSFEALMIYDPALTHAVVAAAAQVLDRPLDTLMEDMGTWLVSHHSGERLRRLLRFGGVGFRDFLHSLEELPARARLALPDLKLPDMRLVDLGGREFTLSTTAPFPQAGYVLMGLLRAMADDYGSLVLLDMAGQGAVGDVIRIQLLDEDFAEGRRFDLAAGMA
jgi:hypothetical protein